MSRFSELRIIHISIFAQRKYDSSYDEVNESQYPELD